MGRTDYWMKEAACRGLDINTFFPPNGGRRHTNIEHPCDKCFVQYECLIYALQNDEQGIWGGMSRAERDKIDISDLDCPDLREDRKIPEATIWWFEIEEITVTRYWIGTPHPSGNSDV